MKVPGTIINPYRAHSEPSIHIVGTGDVTLYIGNQVVLLTGIEAGITIDTEILSAYTDSNPMNHKMQGDFPVLLPGTNEISWVGSVSELSVVPRWRDTL
jgi:phage-related protein